ncbi:hypothetical protein DFJ73DRAFT_867341 [Zopfochytrium polystomum]|nr:hypothetical protein DFJ73DRAFT_867341 [Zopfochytrium polystomum]
MLLLLKLLAVAKRSVSGTGGFRSHAIERRRGKKVAALFTWSRGGGGGWLWWLWRCAVCCSAAGSRADRADGRGGGGMRCCSRSFCCAISALAKTGAGESKLGRGGGQGSMAELDAERTRPRNDLCVLILPSPLSPSSS